MSVSAQQQKIRRIVWTVAIASVTATGAWYGAGLKTRKELSQVRLFPFTQVYLLLGVIVRSSADKDAGQGETTRSHACTEDCAARGTTRRIDCEEVGLGEED